MQADQKLYRLETKVFAEPLHGSAIIVPHIQTPAVRLLDDVALPTADEASSAMLDRYFENLETSDLNVGGAGLIFGTYDNLHLGHLNMLRTGAAVCDHLYVGIESQTAALQRKKNSHPILNDEERRTMLVESGVTKSDCVFVRTTAAADLARLIQNGVEIKTLLVGESQNDNPEMVEAVRLGQARGIRVLAITRTKSLQPGRPISSSALHRRGLARTSQP